MTEKQLIRKIGLLNEIKPEKDWVFSVKTRIIGISVKPSFIENVIETLRVLPGLALKPALVSFAVLALLGGVAGFAQTALPGDPLYAIKRTTEKIGLVFVPVGEQPKAQLELANRRLEELSTIAQNNRTNNLASAISEFKASVGQAVQDMNKIENSPRFVREIAGQIKQIDEKKVEIEALGVIVGETKELNEALARIVGSEIKDLENRFLNENQAKTLEQAKADFERGDFEQALEKLLTLTYPRE